MSDPQSTRPGEVSPTSDEAPGKAPDGACAAEVTPAGGASGATASQLGTAKTLTPLDPPTVPFAVGGMIVWLIVWLVVYWGFRDDHSSWPAICVAGFVLGVPGLAVMLVHDRHRRARRGSALGQGHDQESAPPEAGEDRRTPLKTRRRGPDVS